MAPIMDLDTYLKNKESAVALAKKLKLAPSLLSQWRNKVRPVPAERCPAIERATGRAVTCEEMRPDVDWAYIRGTARKQATKGDGEADGLSDCPRQAPLALRPAA
jgi:DNA-binding transcriptional regulator YdaS (Cro superfamily)